ncbi:hypothetical protein BaRGS_00007639 [Batillaria attramentaria]|uniref:GDP-fucose protein O-fucosyltransferase 1 n=1 Tax=Batillaria attramentaria TaxID=370345 RepID=A0ABD0LNE4_9CAEN
MFSLQVYCRFLALLVVFITVFSSFLSAESETEPLDSTEADERNVPDDPGVFPEIDPNGYVIYCPCMGRFGNQAEQFLGSLGFKNIPFDEWFRLEAVQQYHRAITAETFMRTLAPKVWPEGKRIGWCWLPPRKDTIDYCNMKEGNPFGPFWDGLGVNFDNHIVYRFSYAETDEWVKEYPPDQYPVIALKGPPASYPVSKNYVPLQQYLQWSEALDAQADNYIQKTFPGEKFVGIHLRNGDDWVNACKRTEPDGVPKLMASPQCLGYDSDKMVTKDICFPTAKAVVSQTKSAVKAVGATVVYVATDKDPMIHQLEEALGEKVRVIHQDPWLVQLDLIILGRADHFIGNCVSSFSAFVARERAVKNKTTSHWNFLHENITFGVSPLT